MPFRSFLFLFACIATALTANAQVECNNETCIFALSFDDGLGASPTTIRQAPWSGEERIESATTMANGAHTTTVSQGIKQWRDSEGRQRTERHAYPYESLVFGAKPPDDFTVAQIRDPATGYQYVLDPVARVAHRMKFQPGPSAVWTSSALMTASVSNPTISQGGDTFTHEALGLRPISGIATVGVRNITTRPAPSAGGMPAVSSYDEWFDPQTGVRLLQKETGLDGNAITRTIADYSADEPDPNLFRVPSDYRIVDETGPFKIIHARVPGTTGPSLRTPTAYQAACNGHLCKVTVSPGPSPSVAGLTGAPFSGTPAAATQERKMPDGRIVPGRTLSPRSYYRDSQGRFRVGPVLFIDVTGPKPPDMDVEKIITQIDDPVAGCEYILDSVDHVAYRIVREIRQVPFEFKPKEPGSQTAGNGTVTAIESLPEARISGVAAMGYRVIHTYPPGTYQKNTEQVVLVDEFWNDPRTGEFLFVKVGSPSGYLIQTVPDYTPGDPDPSVFRIPDDYKIVDQTERFTFSIPQSQ